MFSSRALRRLEVKYDKRKQKSLPQEVNSFDEAVDLATYRVEFHRNTSGLCYYGLEVEASNLEEMKEKLDNAITAVQEVIKKRDRKEVGS